MNYASGYAVLSKLYRPQFIPAWLVCGAVVLAFVSGVIVDVDHPIAFVLGIPDGRFLMPYFSMGSYIALGAGAVLAVACLCRYARVRLLKGAPVCFDRQDREQRYPPRMTEAVSGRCHAAIHIYDLPGDVPRSL